MSTHSNGLRILRIADIPNTRAGGMARYIHGVSDILRKQGHVVDHAFGNELRGNRPFNVRLGRFIVPLRALRLVRQRAAAGNSYDVVEVHEPLAAPCAWKRSSQRAGFPPLLVTVYGLEARSLSTRIAYARARGESVSFKERYAPLSVVWQANYALRRADHVSVETTEDAAFLKSELRVPQARITLHPGAVHPEFLRETGEARRDVLFVGSWLRRKGILDLVPAMVQVLDERPGVGLTIAGAGVPDARVFADFPERLHGRIRVMPSTEDDAALAALFRAHEVFVFPSVFEGMPLVILEAAAAGLAIVTTPVCGMRDLVRDGENGLLVPVGVPQDLAAAVGRLVDAPGEARRLGSAARESVRGLTWEASSSVFLTACESAGGARS